MSPKEIIHHIKNLKAAKSPGPDGITNILIKQLPKRCIIFLCNIYNACLKNCHFPNTWKIAKVIPITKIGKDNALVENYRPISLLDTLGKIFEKLIYGKLEIHLQANKIIPNEQLGFRKQLSTNHQLLRITTDIKGAIDTKKSTGLILFDVEKAFDKVWHKGLIYKLIKFKTPSYIIRLLNSYLENRKLFVVYRSEKFVTDSILSGVPQESRCCAFPYVI